MAQSADLVFNPAGVCQRLMLYRNGSKRAWNKKRVPRKLLAAEQSTIETSYEWTSWHMGDGYGFLPLQPPGRMPAYASNSRLSAEASYTQAADTRTPGRITFPPLRTDTAITQAWNTYVTPRIMFRHGNFWYVAGGEKLMKFDANLAWVSTTDLHGGDTDKAINFNGITQTVTKGSPNNFGQTVAVHALINVNTLASNHVIMQHNFGTGASFGFRLQVTAGGIVQFQLGNNVPTTHTANSGAIVANVWWSVFGVYDGNTVQVYVNGVPGTSTTPGAVTINNAAGTFQVGVMANANGVKVSHVAVWGTTLPVPVVTGNTFPITLTDAADASGYGVYSAQGEWERYNLPQLIINSGPKLYWKLNETSGTTAADLSGNANAGTINNTPQLGQAGPALLADAWRAVEFDGNWYIGVGWDCRAWKVDKSGNITQATDAGAKFKHLAVARDKLFFTSARTTVKSVATGADPLVSANWSGGYTTGNSAESINELLANGRVLYISRPDGLNAFDDSLNVINLIPELKSAKDARNGQGMIVWHGGILYPHTRGLFYYVDGAVSVVGPERIIENDTDLSGNFTSFAADGQWVHAVFDNGVRRYLMSARERGGREEGNEPLIWYVLGTVPYATVFSLYNFGGTVYAPSGSSNLSQIARWTLTAAGGTAGLHTQGLGGLGFTGQTGIAQTGVKVLPRLYLGQPGFDDYLRSVELDLENVTATSTVRVYYRLNHSSTWVALGTATTSGLVELPFAAGNFAREIELGVALSYDATGSTPFIRRIALNVIERARKVSAWSAICRVGRGTEDRYGNRIEDDPETVLTLLETYEEASTYQTVVCPDGVARRMVVLDVVTEELEDTEEEGDEHQDPVYIANITMLEVP